MKKVIHCPNFSKKATNSDFTHGTEINRNNKFYLEVTRCSNTDQNMIIP